MTSTKGEGMTEATKDLTMDYVERRSKFKKRAEGNLNRALNSFKQLQRCANRNIYAYDDKQIETIVAELRRGVDEVERAFTASGGEGRRWVEL